MTSKLLENIKIRFIQFIQYHCLNNLAIFVANWKLQLKFLFAINPETSSRAFKRKFLVEINHKDMIAIKQMKLYYRNHMFYII